MGVPQSVDGDHRDVYPLAVPGKNTIHGRVINVFFCNKDGLIGCTPLNQFRKLDNSLPVNLNLANGRSVLGWLKSATLLVVSRFADREGLVSKIKILGREGKRLRKSHTCLGN